MKSNKAVIIFFILFIPGVVLYWYTDTYDLTVREALFPIQKILYIDTVPMHVEIADTEQKRIQGLSGTASLGNIEGLLFVFPKPDYYPIWMKDMKFPIDIIWIGEDLKVVDIDKNVSPDSYPKSFRPEKPVKYIIETNAHYTDTFIIEIGQKVKLPLE